MNKQTLIKIFSDSFPIQASKIDTWFVVGPNTIRIRQTNKQELIFTYNKPTDWSLMTLKKGDKHYE